MTKIEWTHYTSPDGNLVRGQTWNPIKGCSRAGYQPVDGGPKRAHPGCLHCYAERFCGRNLHGEIESGVARWDGTIEFLPARLAWPFEKPGYRARRDGLPTIVFVCSESDMGHPNVSDEVWKVINGAMLISHWNVYKDLTKRPEIQRERLERWSPRECVEALNDSGHMGVDSEAEWADTWEHATHIHRYVSVSDQPTADALIPELLRLPAAVRGVSLEPMTGPVDLAYTCFNGSDSLGTMPGINHVIIGGESGNGARPFDLQWGADVVRQCQEAGVPVYMKQVGAHCVTRGDGCEIHWTMNSRKGSDPAEWPESLRIRQHVGLPGGCR